MRKEGRQRCIVGTCRTLPSPLNSRPDTRFINKFDSPSTCGLFAIVPSKPTNHSNSTGKPRCYMNPAGKSRYKTKGTEKLNLYGLPSGLVSSNSNYKLITWRVVDGRHESTYSGFSATGMLDHLARNEDYDYGFDYDYEEEDYDQYDEEAFI